MKSILLRESNITVAKASISGYGKVCIHDRSFERYIGKKVRVNIEVFEC